MNTDEILDALEAKMRDEAECKDELERLVHETRAELGRLFGECGGVTVSTPHEAWLVLDYERGRVAALEQNQRTPAETEALRAALAWLDSRYRVGATRGATHEATANLESAVDALPADVKARLRRTAEAP